MTRLFPKVMTALRMSRFGVLLTFTVLCLIIGEQYPFSSFPMYSSFSHDTYYIYLADQFDRPIAAQVKLGVSTTRMKKIYDSQLRKDARRLKKTIREMSASDRANAANYLLSYLRKVPRAKTLLPGLRIYDVGLFLKEGRIEKESRLVLQNL
jgi:hypothetical protein